MHLSPSCEQMQFSASWIGSTIRNSLTMTTRRQTEGMIMRPQIDLDTKMYRRRHAGAVRYWRSTCSSS
eukprot:855658-Amphidinium_carterae.1